MRISRPSNNRFLRRFFLICAIAAACSCTSQDTVAVTETDTGSITGSIVNDGNPYTDTVVVVLFAGDSIAGKRTVCTGAAVDSISTSTGSFTFSSLSAGTYSIRVTHNGVPIGEQAGIDLPAGANVTITINVTIVIEQHITIVNIDNSTHLTINYCIYNGDSGAAQVVDTVVVVTFAETDTVYLTADVTTGGERDTVDIVLVRRPDGTYAVAEPATDLPVRIDLVDESNPPAVDSIPRSAMVGCWKQIALEVRDSSGAWTDAYTGQGAYPADIFFIIHFADSLWELSNNAGDWDGGGQWHILGDSLVLCSVSGACFPGNAALSNDTLILMFTDKLDLLCKQRGGSQANERIVLRRDPEACAVAPVITSHPRGDTVEVGDTVVFTACGSGPGLRYQWLRDGAAVTGATTDRYAIDSVAAEDNGAEVRCIVYNDFGSDTTDTAVLTVKQVSVVFHDTFDSDSIDDTVWTIGGNMNCEDTIGSYVAQEDGLLKVYQAQTDCGGRVISREIPIDTNRPFTIRTRVLVHHGASHFRGGLFVSQLSQTGMTQVCRMWHCNYTNGRIQVGFGLGYDSTSLLPPLWDEWVEETLVIDPVSEMATYTYGGHEPIQYGLQSTLTEGAIVLDIHSWGWGTGHYHWYDYVRVEQ